MASHNSGPEGDLTTPSQVISRPSSTIPGQSPRILSLNLEVNRTLEPTLGRIDAVCDKIRQLEQTMNTLHMSSTTDPKATWWRRSWLSCSVGTRSPELADSLSGIHQLSYSISSPLWTRSQQNPGALHDDVQTPVPSTGTTRTGWIG